MIRKLLAAASSLVVLACAQTLGSPQPQAADRVLAATRATLQAGPMVGYSDMREVLLWAQTTDSAAVHFVYWDTAAPGVRRGTRPQLTRSRDAFTTKHAVAGLEPGKRYAYEVWVNGTRVNVPYPLRFQTQQLWQWRTDPPAFRLALGSCFYVNEPEYDRPGQPYGGEYEILAAISQTRPDVMLWLGDNTYYREVDWHSRSGMLHRFTHTRSLPELQPLLGATHHYAIWDDHDFGPDNSDRSWYQKETALDVFRLFWGNPTFGLSDSPGVTTSFQWADVDFFLLDNRYHRAPNARVTGERTVLGAAQFEWLIDALRTSRAPFKIVAIGGQVLNPLAEYETYANVGPDERRRLIDAITREKIPGVFFVTGDRHASDLTRIERAGTYPLYDLTVSPLTAGVHSTSRGNPGTVAGTLATRRNFALLDFSGPRTDRVMRIALYGSDGQELWNRSVRASELR